jgi:hypothetical protein
MVARAASAADARDRARARHAPTAAHTAIGVQSRGRPRFGFVTSCSSPSSRTTRATASVGCPNGTTLAYQRTNGAGPHAVTAVTAAGTTQSVAYTAAGNVASYAYRDYAYDGLDRLTTASR